METNVFIIEFREKVSNKRDCFVIKETTISKAFEKGKKLCKTKDVKLIGIKEA
jgi:hypothetical protein